MKRQVTHALAALVVIAFAASPSGAEKLCVEFPDLRAAVMPCEEICQAVRSNPFADVPTVKICVDPAEPIDCSANYELPVTCDRTGFEQLSFLAPVECPDPPPPECPECPDPVCPDPPPPAPELGICHRLAQSLGAWLDTAPRRGFLPDGSVVDSPDARYVFLPYWLEPGLRDALSRCLSGQP